MYPTIWLTNGQLQFLNLYAIEIHLVFVIILLVAAVISDVRAHRIPNWLVATGVVIAVVTHAFLPFGQGANFSLVGLAVGVASLLPLYALGTMGAGDVKLMGMVGAFVGTAAVINVVLATMVAGGLFALGVTAYKRMLPQLVSNLRDMVIQRHIRSIGFAATVQAPPSVGKMPYAVAIATGTFVQIFFLRA